MPAHWFQGKSAQVASYFLAGFETIVSFTDAC